MFFTKVAVQYPHGAITIQNSFNKDWVWVADNNAKVSRTLELMPDKILVVAIYEVERGVMEAMACVPHPRGGTHFWEMRRLSHAIMVQPKTEWDADEWVSASFQLVLPNARSRMDLSLICISISQPRHGPCMLRHG